MSPARGKAGDPGREHELQKKWASLLTMCFVYGNEGIIIGWDDDAIEWGVLSGQWAVVCIPVLMFKPGTPGHKS